MNNAKDGNCLPSSIIAKILGCNFWGFHVKETSIHRSRIEIERVRGAQIDDSRSASISACSFVKVDVG